MRLAYLVGTYPSRSETFVARELAALPQHGVEVAVVSFRVGPDGPSPEAYYRPKLLGRGPLGALAGGGAGHPGGLARILAEGGRRAPRKPDLAWRWLRNLPFAAWLVQFCRDHGCDGVHAGWGGVPVQVAWMAQQLGGPGYTVACHAHEVFGPPHESAAAMGGALGWTVCNHAARAALAARYPALAGRVAYHPHGLPLSDWPRRTAEPDGPPVVLGIGRLVDTKGFDTLIAASGAVAPQTPHELVLVGEGPDRERLEALGRQHGAPLALPGYQRPPEVRRWLERATAFALPSRSDAKGLRDGMANVLLEAMAVGVPVVSTPAGSATDAIANGVTGLLVPPGDAPALVNALQRLLTEPGLRIALADSARAVVREQFDVEVNVDRLAAWLRSCHQPAEVEK